VRRRRLLAAAAAALCGSHGSAQGAPAFRVEVRARKFAFEPAQIRVALGQHVTLLLTSVDFPHGFALPDFGVRRDLVPGKAVELSFVADKAGRFHMLCDNFCGEEHDRMSGWLIVNAAELP